MTLLPFPVPKEAKVQGRPFMFFYYYIGIFSRIANPAGHDLPADLHSKKEQRCDASPYLF
ncbi:MAG: hypothetical protein LAT83_03150 [Kiritimatiellae bacterium]|nr:hypothetical protein [Kiritimatiellia bacterium]